MIKHQCLVNLYTLILVVLPVLGIYRIFPFPNIVLWGCFGVFLFLFQIFKGQKIDAKRTLLEYCVYVIVSSGLSCVFSGDVSFVEMVRYQAVTVMYVFSFYWLAGQLINFNMAKRMHIFFSVLFTVLLFVQIIGDWFGYTISLLLPGFTVYGELGFTSDDIVYVCALNSRFCSVFLEPAHYAQYCLPALAFLLFFERKILIKHLVMAVLISLGMVLSTSSQGVIITGCLWLYYIFRRCGWKCVVYLGGVIACVVALLTVGADLFRDLPIVDMFWSRFESIVRGEGVTNRSTYMRLVIGWDIYELLPVWAKLFGCGCRISEYIKSTGIGLSMYLQGEYIGYMSGISMLFCTNGIIGSLLYFRFLWSRIKDHIDSAVVAMSIVWVLILLSSANFNSLSVLLPMVFVFAYVEEKSNFRKMTMSGNIG